jgi:hypothetical protein
VTEGPVEIAFPLGGEWTALNSPLAKGHQTDFFGQRYALDLARFVWPEGPGRPWPQGASLAGYIVRWALGRLRAADDAGWGEAVRAPLAGAVVAAEDGWPDTRRPWAVRDLARLAGLTPDTVRLLRGERRALLGNYVAVEAEGGVCAVLAHLQRGSVRVREGDRVAEGDAVGALGNSGSSTGPHLHLHLMRGRELWTATPVPLRFRAFDEWGGGAWHRRAGAVPGELSRIRAPATASR